MTGPRFSRYALLAALAAAWIGIAAAWADSDHARARDAVRRGDALPLSAILEKLGDRLGGEVIEVEFEREDGLYVYEFEIVTPTGQVQEVYVDARTGEIMGREDD